MAQQKTTTPTTHQRLSKPARQAKVASLRGDPGSQIGPLQRRTGNRAFGRLIQAKLTIGAPNDQYEQEANYMADRVMRMPNPVVQRQSPHEDDEIHQPLYGEKERIQKKPLVSEITPLVQRQTEEENEQLPETGEPPQSDDEQAVLTKPDPTSAPVIQKEEDEEPSVGELQPMAPGLGDLEMQTKSLTDNPTIQKPEEGEEEHVPAAATEALQSKSNGTVTPVPSNVEANIDAMKGGGAPLPKETRNFFEPRFGTNFSSVRIHTDSRASDSAKSVNASAFTVGNNIAFGPGQYSPDTEGGKNLIAHELTHVVQQGGSKGRLQSSEVTVSNHSGARLQRVGWSDITGAVGGAARWVGGKVAGAAGAAWEGAKWAGGKLRQGASWVGGKIADAFMWIYEKIKGLVNSGVNWIQSKWQSLKEFAMGGLNAVKNLFSGIVKFVKSPLTFLTDAIMNMDAEAIKKSWGSFTQLVLKTWDKFHKMGMALLRTVESLWETLSGFADALFEKVNSLTSHWAFRRLPSPIQNVVHKLVQSLRSLWNTVKAGWKSIFDKVKTFVDRAFQAVREFVQKVLSFAIDKIILGILAVGQVLLFLKDFLSNPQKYLIPLSQKIAGYLDGVESRFSSQIGKYFGGEDKAAKATQESNNGTAGAVVQRQEDSTARDSATWTEIGDGIWDIMKKKWAKVKEDPLSIVLTILRDLAFPIIGNIEDIIQLFKDIKKIVTKPFRAGSLKDFWTSLLHWLDIPILLYNTFWSIIGRSLAIPLIVASFIPHPLVKAIAIAAGYALLAALIQGELANISHKLLLLRTGNTNENEKVDAYNRTADSLIAFALELAMAIVILIVSAVANVIKGVFNFVKGKVFRPGGSSKGGGGDIEGGSRPDSETDTRPDSDTETRTDTDAESRTDTDTETRTDTDAETRTDTDTERRTDTDTETRTDTDAETRTDTDTETRTDADAEMRTDSESRTGPESEVRPEDVLPQDQVRRYNRYARQQKAKGRKPLDPLSWYEKWGKKPPRNPHGKRGDPAHEAEVARLRQQAQEEFPNDIIHEGTSIKKKTGLSRQPDVWVEDANTGAVKKVYEAARTNPDGSFVRREMAKKADYDAKGIPSEFGDAGPVKKK